MAPGPTFPIGCLNRWPIPSEPENDRHDLRHHRWPTNPSRAPTVSVYTSLMVLSALSSMTDWIFDEQSTVNYP